MALLFLLPAVPAHARPWGQKGYAGQYGPPLTLHAANFLDSDDALPALQARPDAAAYFDAWPDQVTLRCYRFGPRRMVRRVAMVVGGIHGDEAVSYIVPELLVRQLMTESQNPSPGSLYRRLMDTGTQLYIVPLVNPYGTLAGVRPNFRTPTALEWLKDELSPAEWSAKPEWWDRRKGVDLNRNYPVNLDCADPPMRHPDPEATHDFAAPGGCHEQELYYGGLLAENNCDMEPAGRWLYSLVKDIEPDVFIALHQEARVIYADLGRELTGPELDAWAHVIDETHDYLNGFLEADTAGWPAAVEFGLTKKGEALNPRIAVNDFSPGGYGAAFSPFSGAVMTVEMTHNQSDWIEGTCWFPEGLLATFSPDLTLGTLRNTGRLAAIVDRFRGPILNYIFHLDPDRPGAFTMSPPAIA
ncbi:MAG TPA: M14 family zinc carboxypeptidase, partial [bacterium]|nr:M14 family zinc carboxypeptidase [bacterium]